MGTVGSIVAAYAVTAIAVGIYTGWLLARGRMLSKRVPAAQRRWVDK